MEIGHLTWSVFNSNVKNNVRTVTSEYIRNNVQVILIAECHKIPLTYCLRIITSPRI